MSDAEEVERVKQQKRAYYLANKKHLNERNNARRAKNPAKEAARRRAYFLATKPRRYELNRLYVQKHAARVAELQRRNRLRIRYGITVEQYDLMLLRQGGKCAICDTKDGQSTGMGVRLVVDHDHAVPGGGQPSVRGLLCQSCNSILGLAGDSAPRLRRMLAYLESWDSR